MSVSPVRKPIIDLVLEQQLATLGTGTTPDDDRRRFELYVEATKRAVECRNPMPDLPDDVYMAVGRTLDAEFEVPPYRGLEIPVEVTAASGRRAICKAIAGGDMAGAAQLSNLYAIARDLG